MILSAFIAVSFAALCEAARTFPRTILAMIRGPLPAPLEECTQHRCALLAHQSRLALDAVIQRRMLDDVENGAGSTRARIRRRIDESLHARVHHCAGAHRTGLE